MNFRGETRNTIVDKIVAKRKELINKRQKEKKERKKAKNIPESELYKGTDACRMHTLYFRRSYRGSGDGAVNQRR